jgi:hypothetical protein
VTAGASSALPLARTLRKALQKLASSMQATVLTLLASGEAIIAVDAVV